MSTMDDRTRFSKAFIIIKEKAAKWVATFVDERIRCRHNNKSLRVFIGEILKNNGRLTNDKLLQKAQFKALPQQLDISVLAKIVRNPVHPSITDTNERKTYIGQSKKVGDLVEQILNKRNELVHTTEAMLDPQDYEDFKRAMEFIADNFEKVNGVQMGTYYSEIDEVDITVLDTKEVNKVITEFQEYVKDVVLTELQQQVIYISGPPQVVDESHARQYAQQATEKIDNPIGKMIVGAGSGTIGFAVDVISSPLRIAEGIFGRLT